MIFETLLGMYGLEMQIERNGKIIATIPGMLNSETGTNRQYVGFRPGTDIKSERLMGL